METPELAVKSLERSVEYPNTYSYRTLQAHRIEFGNDQKSKRWKPMKKETFMKKESSNRKELEKPGPRSLKAVNDLKDLKVNGKKVSLEAVNSSASRFRFLIVISQ